jgi:hypothetical protein
MGRTVPSFRMQIDFEIERLVAKFGKDLDRKKRDKLRLMLDQSKKHSMASSQATSLFPVYSMIMAILCVQNEVLNDLEEELRKCGNQVD